MSDPTRPVTGYPAFSSAPYSTHAPYYYAPPPPRATLLRRLIGAVILSFIIAGTIIFISYIILRPQIPIIQSTSLSLSSFNLTSSSLLTATWTLTLAIRNPNDKVSLTYDHIEASVFYGSVSLSETTLPPFTQLKGNETVTTVNFVSAGAYVEGKAGEGMGKDKREKGSVEFNVRMLARVRYRAGWWKARPRFLRVYCKGLTVAFVGNGGGGEMKGGPRQCRVGL